MQNILSNSSLNKLFSFTGLILQYLSEERIRLSYTFIIKLYSTLKINYVPFINIAITLWFTVSAMKVVSLIFASRLLVNWLLL